MEIQQIRVIRGPNVYHYRPVLIATVDLGEWAEVSSDSQPGFTERLLGLLPGLSEHHCSLGRPGGFVTRLERGTYFTHIIEHVALELSGLAGIPVSYGKTVYAGRPGLYDIIVRYRSEEAMAFLLREALALVLEAARGSPFEIEPVIATAKRILREKEVGPSTAAILHAAEERGIPWARLNSENLIQLGYGRGRRLIRATITEFTSEVAVDLAQDKELTKQFLQRAALPVPRGKVVRKVEEALAAWRELGSPVAVKPLDGHQGEGVSLALANEEEVAMAFRLAAEYSAAVVVEEYVPGRDLRVLVVNGRAVAAAERIPAAVEGDGRRSLAELIRAANEDPQRGEGHEKPLTRIALDTSLREFLRRKSLGLDYVPPAGARICLRETANLSTGGSAIDRTNEVHPSLLQLSEAAARVIGLDVCGVDLVVADPASPLHSQRAVILEVNAAPGLRMHHHPSLGTPRDAGGAIVDYLYPPGTSARIPIIAITGTNGKTTVTRLLGSFFHESGLCTGVTTSDGIFVGGHCIAPGDTTGPRSAEAVLANPQVEVAVLETARGGIVRGGLAYDWSEVGVLTNIQLDHIGQDGIESLDDIVRIKSLVAERVREGGTLVLGAEDPNLLKIAASKAVRRLPRRLVFFSVDPENPALRQHLGAGGTGYFARDGVLFEAGAAGEFPLLRSTEIALTFGGRAGFQVANVLAAIAAARSLGITVERIVASLRNFVPGRNNLGRANLYRLGRGYLLVDYGHNPAAIQAIGELTAHWSKGRVTGIVGLPGDRADHLIRLAARAAARAFDRLFVREDSDLRGRRPGETARLICEAACEEAPLLSCQVELDGRRCLERALREMEPGELVVFVYDTVEELHSTLAAWRADPVIDSRELFAEEGEFEAAG